MKQVKLIMVKVQIHIEDESDISLVLFEEIELGGIPQMGSSVFCAGALRKLELKFIDALKEEGTLKNLLFNKWKYGDNISFEDAHRVVDISFLDGGIIKIYLDS